MEPTLRSGTADECPDALLLVVKFSAAIVFDPCRHSERQCQNANFESERGFDTCGEPMESVVDDGDETSSGTSTSFRVEGFLIASVNSTTERLSTTNRQCWRYRRFGQDCPLPKAILPFPPRLSVASVHETKRSGEEKRQQCPPRFASLATTI